MPKLIKNATTTYIPGDPGNPGSPATVARTAYWTTGSTTACNPRIEYVTVCGGDDSLKFGAAGSSCVSIPRYTSECATSSVLVYHPAVAGSTGTPYSPPTAAQINISLNVGWNSYASSIGKLEAGKYLSYTIKAGTTGALLGVGYAGKEGDTIGSFTHGLMTDISTIQVFESGVSVATLGANAPGAEIHIARLSDGRMVYSVGNVFHISTAPSYLPSEDLYVYGMLYSGYDEISSAAFAPGDLLNESAAAISGTGSLSAGAEPSVRISGAGTIVAAPYPTVTVSGTSSLSAAATRDKLIEVTISGAGKLIAYGDTSGRGYGSLPLFVGIGGDTDYIQGYGELPLFVSGTTNGQSGYIPPEINRGYGNLPFFVGYARGIDIGIGTGSADLPLFAGVAGDYDYGFARGGLPMLIGAAYSGFVPDDTLIAISSVLAANTFGTYRDIVMVFTSTGQLASVLTLDRIQALELLSALQATSTLEMLGIYGYSFLSDARGLSIQTLSANNRPDLNDNGVVWVVNTSNNASSRYEQYGFNSFFTRAGKAYGVANDGIYLLEGDTDNGAQIAALADFGRSNFGSPQLKSIANVYLGVGSDNTLYLKVDADGREYIYEMRDSSLELKNHRVDLGRGLRGNNWNMTLINRDGADFKLASVVFEPMPLPRKI